MESNGQEKNICCAIINNIPCDYHSCDLRNYFSQFIESRGFECFHFRHRPEKTSVPESVKNKNAQETKDLGVRLSTTCCVVKLKAENLVTFMKMYNRKHWVDRRGEVMARVCYISKVRRPTGNDAESVMKTRAEQKLIPPDRESFTDTDLQNLPELHPPDIMPNGNVGTPTMIFMTYIKQCRLPPSIIKKLGLSFPKTRTSKQYGNVPFDYGGDIAISYDDDDNETDDVLTASGHEIVPEQASCDTADSCDSTNQSSEESSIAINSENNSADNVVQGKAAADVVRESKAGMKKSWRDEEAKHRMNLNIEEKMIGETGQSEEDNDSCEEWERHEALYDDPSNQERNKERLFEEEIELKWEKGGSGLVFYTDAQYWQGQEGDFDEQTADDWDVDMSAYYEKGTGDMDARDFLTMRQEKRRRDGIERTDRYTSGIAVKKKKAAYKADETTEIGQFEVHTRGFGRKIMEDQGWADGQGLGSTIRGMADALDNEGQKPKDRRGLGYHGEKLNRNPGVAKRKVIISTMYDDPNNTDPNEPLKRRHEPYHLKYRDEVRFSKSETVQFNTDGSVMK